VSVCMCVLWIYLLCVMCTFNLHTACPRFCMCLGGGIGEVRLCVCVCVCSRGLDQLWAAEGWIDRNMTLGHDGMFDLIRRGFVTYSLGSYLI